MRVTSLRLGRHGHNLTFMHAVCAAECPGCGNNVMDTLEWDADCERVTCLRCAVVYVP